MSLNWLTDLGVEYAIIGGLLVVKQNTGTGGSSLWDTTDKAVIEAEIQDLKNKTKPTLFSPTETYEIGEHVVYNDKWYEFTSAKTAGVWDENVVKEVSKSVDRIVTIGINDSSADFNTADYADNNATFQAAYDEIITRKGGEIHILGGKENYVDYALDSNDLNFNNLYIVTWKGVGLVQLRSKAGTGPAVLIRHQGTETSKARGMHFENLKITNVDRNALGTVADQETYAIVSNHAVGVTFDNVETEMFEKAIRVADCLFLKTHDCFDNSGDINSVGAKNHFSLNNVEYWDCQRCKGSINDTSLRLAGVRNAYVRDFEYKIGSIEISNFEAGGPSHNIWLMNGKLLDNNGNAIGLLIKGDGATNDDNTVLVDGVKCGVDDIHIMNVNIGLDDLAGKQPHALYASGEGTAADIATFPDIHIGRIYISDCHAEGKETYATNVQTYGFTFSNETFKRKVMKVVSTNNTTKNVHKYGQHFYNVVDLQIDGGDIFNANQALGGQRYHKTGIAIWGSITDVTKRAKINDIDINMNENAFSYGIYIDENYIEKGALELSENSLTKTDVQNGGPIKFEQDIQKGYLIQNNTGYERAFTHTVTGVDPNIDATTPILTLFAGINAINLSVAGASTHYLPLKEDLNDKDIFYIYDKKGDAETNNATIQASTGTTIEGNNNVIIDSNKGYYKLQYSAQLSEFIVVSSTSKNAQSGIANYTILVDTSTSDQAVTLDASLYQAGDIILVKDIAENASNFNTTITTSVGTIDGDAIKVIDTDDFHMWFVYTGTEFQMLRFTANNSGNTSSAAAIVFDQNLATQQALSNTSVNLELLTGFEHTIVDTAIHDVNINVNLGGVNHKNARLILTKNGTSEAQLIAQDGSIDQTYTLDSVAGSQTLQINKKFQFTSGDIVRAYIKQDSASSDSGIVAEITSNMQITKL